MYDNFDQLSGVSFLPVDLGTYRQAPYQECTKEAYEEALALMPDSLDWEKFASYESDDNTTSAQQMACVSGYCEI